MNAMVQSDLGKPNGAHSVTQGLNDQRRQKINELRLSSGHGALPEVDFAQQAVEKIQAWPYEHDTRNVVI